MGDLRAHWDAVHEEPEAPEAEAAEPEAPAGQAPEPDEAEPPPPEPLPPLTLAELHAVVGDRFAAAHARLVEQGTPSQPAATYLAGWWPGSIASSLGIVVAATGALPLLEPARCVLTPHPEGWLERVDLGHPALLVEPGHRWAGADGVEVVAAEAGRRRFVEALVAGLGPLVEACRSLAKVGRAGLWNEVADGLGTALGFQSLLDVDEAAIARTAAVLAAPGAPWKARPSLRLVAAPGGRRRFVVQKGGCCLAYTEPPEPGTDELPLLERYCSTCSFRTVEDCDARQLAWLEEHHPA